MKKTNLKMRILSMFLCVLMVCTAIPTTVFAIESKSASVRTTGWDGTSIKEPTADESGVYQIGTAEELAWFAGLVNGDNGNSATSAACAVLTADIDLNDMEWTPIGKGNTYTYAGTFDGKDYTISGLYSTGANNQVVGLYTGLFGNAKAATIKNLKVKGNITVCGNFSGGIAGKIWSSSILENCISYVNITVSSTATSSINYVGGITGQVNNATVKNCINYGDVKGELQYIGGIAGAIAASAKVENCSNEGMIFASGQPYTGGIIGKSNAGIVDACYNMGMVISDNAYVGGITGNIAGSGVTISNCYNLGTIIGLGGKAAGIAGTVDKGTLKNCYTASNLKLAGDDIGNVVGASAVDITDCYYLEEMLADEDVIGTEKSGDFMKTSDFVSALGDSFKAGCSYPILSWQDDGTHIYDETTGKCTVDGCEVTAEHVWKDATCTEAMTCTLCEETRGSALEHHYADGVCLICGDTETSVVAEPFDLRLSENTEKLSYTTLDASNLKLSNLTTYFVSLEQNVSSIFFAVGDAKYSSACTLDTYEAKATLTTEGDTLELKDFAQDITNIVNDTTDYDSESYEYYAVQCSDLTNLNYFCVVLQMPKAAEVEKEAPTAITLPETVSVYLGATITLTPEVTPANADTTMIWSSSNSEVATVDSLGGVKGLQEGAVTITAKAKKDSSVTATTTLKVIGVVKSDVDWAGAFNHRYDNNNVTSVGLPSNSETVSESWSAAVSNSTIAIVGDYVYTYACSQPMSGYTMEGKPQTFYKIDKNTGVVVNATYDCPGKGGYYFGYTLYGEKYIYVSCPNAIMAFDPDTCEMVWSNTDYNLGIYPCAQYVNGYVIVNGYVFDGKNGNFVKNLEGDYSYSNGAVSGNYFYVADYNGVLYAFNTTTWEAVDSMQFKKDTKQLQPGVLYYNGKLYWGDAINTNIYSIELTARGMFNDATFKTTSCGYTTVCTPVAYGDRIYLAGQTALNYNPVGIVGVYSAEDLSVIYTTPLSASLQKIQSTPILYADEANNTVTLWMQSYNSSTIYTLKDTPTTKENSLSMLTKPSKENYAWEQIACDNEGNLYACNDSGILFKFVDKKVVKPTVDNFTNTKFTYTKGDDTTALKISAVSSDEGKLSYQWMESSDGFVWSYLEGENTATYTPSTSSVGTTYYQCAVTNTLNGESESSISNMVTVVVDEDTSSEDDVETGDANGDGKINATDASLILRYAAGYLTDSDVDTSAMDVNGDGKVNATDASLILRHAAGLLDKFPVNE